MDEGALVIINEICIHKAEKSFISTVVKQRINDENLLHDVGTVSNE